MLNQNSISMNKETDFRALIHKFLAEEISDSDLNLLKIWLDTDIGNRRIFDEENQLWHESGIKIRNEHFRVDKAWAEISEQLGIEINKPPVFVIKRSYFRLLAAAASVVLLIAIGGVALWLSSAEQLNFASTIITTGEGDNSQVLLCDSTVIYMNSASKIEYSNDYDINTRIVKLSGEAFFDVHTNPEKPFFVQLDNISVTATGTRFNVLSYDNENRIEATLEEGNINIVIDGKEPIYLKTGQQVVYFRKTDEVIVREVSTETYTSWKENKLRFIDTPFEEVLRKIGRRYNVTFEIRNRELLELNFTATFIDESIEEVMSMLKAVSPISYKIINRTTVNDKNYLKPKIVIGKNWTLNEEKKYL
jgi:transmembrane sensor